MKNYENTLGYTKDKIAAILFLLFSILLYFVKDFNKLKNAFIFALLIGFTIDGTFTINPNYHFEKFGNNIPTYVVILGAIAFITLIIIYRKEIKFTF